MFPFLRRYATATAASTHLRIPITKRGVVDFADSADWTPVAGDVKLSKDGGAAQNIGTLPTAVAMGNATYWQFQLTAAELSCRNLVVTVGDLATKAVEDQMFVVETFGDASAQFRSSAEAKPGAVYRPYNAAASVRIPITKKSSVDFAVSANWTPTAGQVKVSKDGAAAANIATLPVAVAMGNTAYWQFSLSAAELMCSQLVVVISDGGSSIEDQAFIVETYVPASSSTGGYVAYGNYEFPLGFHIADKGRTWLVPMQKLARNDGGADQTGYREPRRIVVRGRLMSDDSNLLATGAETLRSKIDDLAAALASQPASLYGSSDRYWRNTRCRSMPEIYGATGNNRFTEEFDIDFTAADPFEYSTSQSSLSFASVTNGATLNVTVGGNVYNHPVIQVTAGATGSLDITLSNGTEEFQLAGSVTSGDVIEVDCLDQTVTIDNADQMDLFDGEWLSLGVGTSTLTLTVTSGTVSSIVVTWRDRWQ